MKKSDAKAFFLIIIILLIVSAIAMFGIIKYTEIINKQNDTNYPLYGGNTTILPDENTKNSQAENSQENSILNQIVPIENNQIQIGITNSKINEEYYYKQLNSYSKVIYNALKNNKENLKTGTYKIEFEKEFDELLVKEDGSELLQNYYQSAIETFLYENPDVFYLAPTKMYINIQTTRKVFITTYKVFIDSGENANYFADGYTSKQQIENCEQQINEEVQQILLIVNKGKNDYQKIKKVHDYLVESISYDQSISKDNIYNIYGALVNKECVCEGYAKAFKYLMNQIGIESIIVTGDATDSEGKMQNHAWNYVKYDNKWYAIDVTWDDPIIIGGIGIINKKYKYKYFLKGSETMKKDHIVSSMFVEGGTIYEQPILSTEDFE